jgi:hypothetical protein
VKLLSWRFAPHLLVIYALAAALSLFHTFAPSSSDDCARPSALPRWESRDDDRGRWLRDYFGAFQWSEGSFEADQALFSFLYLRSYLAIPLLNRPENVLVRLAPDQRSVEWIDTESGPVPIHRAIYEPRADRATRILAGYLLLLDGQPLAQPTFATLAAAPRQLFLGRTPMTLLFIHGRVPRDQYAEAEAELRVRLLQALAQYRDACRPARQAGRE